MSLSNYNKYFPKTTRKNCFRGDGLKTFMGSTPMGVHLIFKSNQAEIQPGAELTLMEFKTG